MALVFSVSSSANSAGSQNPSQAITIDPGAGAGHMCLYVVSIVSLGASPTVTASSTATQPVQVGSSQIQAVPAPGFVHASLWKVDATSSDPSATVTFSSTVNGFWAVGQGVWSDAGLSPSIDVSAGTIAAAGATSVTCPSLTTTRANDWALYFLGGTCQSNLSTGPAGTTQRLNITSSVGVPAAIFDSNASVGGAGTGIGGGVFTASGTNANQAMAAFTVGLAPHSAAPASSGLLLTAFP